MHPWGIASALSLPLEESNMNPFSFCKGRDVASVHQQLHCDYPGNTWQPVNEEQLLQSTPSRQGACKDSGLRQWHDISASLTSNFTEQQPFDNQERTPAENESARHDIKKDTRVWVWVRYESTFCGPWMNRANYIGMFICSIWIHTHQSPRTTFTKLLTSSSGVYGTTTCHAPLVSSFHVNISPAPMTINCTIVFHYGHLSVQGDPHLWFIPKHSSCFLSVSSATHLCMII